ncbi:MAG: IclR family transcriptional regulator [Deltaproteobacteria bacterium]|nr:IclR family transcriptional regulator [Deltaproteobacteria bacterium]
MSKGKYYFSKSLEKGLKILALFNRESPVLTQSEIARTMDLNPTSTHRYINTLVELGYLEKDAKTKEIRPSLLCLLLCTNLMRATDHLRMIKEVVDRIHSENNISIDVAFVVDDTIVHIYHREAEETLTYRLPDFSENCLHNTALGKAHLSSLPDDLIVEKIDTMNLIARTKKTIVDKDALVAELQKSKARQYTMSNEEFLPGLVAIGAPLYDPISGKGVGAVSFDFSVLQNSAQEIKTKYEGLIKEMATTISELLPPDKNRR